MSKVTSLQPPQGSQSLIAMLSGPANFRAPNGRVFPGAFQRWSSAWDGQRYIGFHTPRTFSYGAGDVFIMEGARTNVIPISDMSTGAQAITVTAQKYTLSIAGSGSVALTGAATGTVTESTPLTFTPSAGTLTLTPTGTVDHAQLEAGAWGTSRIKTTGIADTRAADFWQIKDLGNIAIKGRPWTLAFAHRHMEGIIDSSNGSNPHRVIAAFGDNTDTNAFRFYRIGGGSTQLMTVRAGTRQDFNGVLSISKTAFKTVFLVWDGNTTLKIYEDGVLLSSPTSAQISDLMTNFTLGSKPGDDAYAMFGYIAPGAPKLGIPVFQAKAMSQAEVTAAQNAWKPLLDAITLPSLLKKDVTVGALIKQFGTAPMPVKPKAPAGLTWTTHNTVSLNSSNGSGEIIYDGKNLRNLTDNPMFDISSSFTGILTLKNCYIQSIGSVIRGYSCRVRVINNFAEILAPVTVNKAPGRFITIDGPKSVYAENNTVVGANRFFYGGPASGNVWLGDYNAGDLIYISKNEAWNIDGRRSDGAGGRIKSQWGETHGSNSIRIAKNGVIGWDVGNFGQFNGLQKCVFEYSDNIVLNELGLGRSEDTLSFFGGSGGRSGRRGIIRGNLFDVTGGWDLMYNSATSTHYNPSNTVYEGATSGQPDPVDYMATRQSGTAILIGDGVNTADYDGNSAYIDVIDNDMLGARSFMSFYTGHHNVGQGNRIILPGTHWNGTPYMGYTDGGLGYSNYGNYKLADGTTQIWGYNQAINNIVYKGAATAPIALGAPGQVLTNGGSASGNIQLPAPLDGGRAMIALWRAKKAAEGKNIGTSLAIVR